MTSPGTAWKESDTLREEATAGELGIYHTVNGGGKPPSPTDRLLREYLANVTLQKIEEKVFPKKGKRLAAGKVGTMQVRMLVGSTAPQESL